MSRRAELLDEAILALRDETSGASDSASATRRKILLATTRRRKRRSFAVRLALPLAAVLAVSSAWAAANGGIARLGSMWSALVAPTHERSPPTATLPLPPPLAPPPGASPDPGIDAVGAPSAPTLPSPLTLPSATTAIRPDAPRRAASAPRAEIAPSQRVDREETLYHAAHDAHFVSRDPSRALAAWDAYLAEHPRGRFAPEARYNRALTLVRLGRRDDAREALRPFAGGAFGGYRQREATELLDAMGAPRPKPSARSPE
jgi:TolA-binding protein